MSNDEIITALENIVAELDKRMGDLTINSVEGRITMESIYHIEFAVERLITLVKISNF